MAFKAHIDGLPHMMSLFGIVVMLWWANTGSITETARSLSTLVWWGYGAS